MAELVREDFVYLSGDDGSAAEAMLAGAAGTVSVVANLVPKAFRALCDAAVDGRGADAQRCAEALRPLIQALDCAPNPIAVKAGLPWLGLGLGLPRLPLVELNDGPERARLHQALSTLASLASAAA
jgi:4-hydroxy-tetrahydrodipicolinate synthase